MAKLISQSCGESQLADCLSREDGVNWRPSKHSWISDRLEKEAWVKADCSTFSSFKHIRMLLVHWCSYQMAMKSVSWNSACIRPPLANLVTYGNQLTPLIESLYHFFIRRDESILLFLTYFLFQHLFIPTNHICSILCS